KADGSQKVVSLIRDEIVIDETFAHSVIVDNGKAKIGFILVPEFYIDFENPKGAHASADVRKEVIKLKEEKVDGIIVDVRTNPGGGLYDVIDMAGLFIEDGPIVQVKDRDGKASVLKDRDKSILYDGPLAVMVNEFSASAAEIFAAAIQDYKRGVIIGSSSTYGKGTVQRSIGLEPTGNVLSNDGELGAVKVTLQKYYRIDGGSVQLKGVKSDIVLPDIYEYLKFREKDVPDALPWDVIAKADYTVWKPGYDLKDIQAKSASRVLNNPAFKTIKANTEWLDKQNDKMYSLNIDKYRQERKLIGNAYKQMDSLGGIEKPFLVRALTGEENKYANDKNKADRLNAWMKALSKDIYLNEAMNVMNDMVAAKKAPAQVAVTASTGKK
ncbi:MAG: carboxy terminal-processing peptidase, partial [Chitinophagaceae bacterium]